MTGGAGTLALVNARALLEHGLTGLVLFDRDLSHGSTEIERLREDFPASRILTKRVNVTDVAQVERAVEETVEELGSVDILCCFAGVVSCAHAIEVTPEEWKRTLDVNTTGAFLCAQSVARYSSPSPSNYFFPELTFEQNANISLPPMQHSVRGFHLSSPHQLPTTAGQLQCLQSGAVVLEI